MNIVLKEGIRISDRGTAFDPSTGETFTLNTSGLEILRRLAGGEDFESIFSGLSDEYDINRGDLDRYMTDFISVLKSFQLLENEP